LELLIYQIVFGGSSSLGHVGPLAKFLINRGQ